MMAKKAQLEVLDLDARELATLMGWTRVVVGTLLFMAPRKVMSGWVGDPGSAPATPVAARAAGARDAAIGLGLLLALEGDGKPRRWLEAGAIADAADSLAVLAEFREVGGIRGLFWAAVAGGSAWLNLQLAEALD
jgi:hypothetical protein